MNNRALDSIRRTSYWALMAASTVALPVSHAMAAAPAASATETAVQEVLVTARRREESLQEIPLTIAAFSGDQLEQSNVSNVQDLAVLVPNLQITGGGSTQGTSSGDFRMRGIPGVARYMDGIYLSGGQGALQSVVELERVEVLRGPQGTLFGRGAIGGALQYISKDPQKEFGARIRATVGTHERRDVTANVDVPLGDTVFTKFTAANLHRGGFVDSTTIDKDFGGTDEKMFRAALLWTPTDALTIKVSGQFSDIEEDGDPQVLFAVTPQLVARNNTPATGQPTVSLQTPNDPMLYNICLQSIANRCGLTGTPLTNDNLPGEYKTRSNQSWPSYQQKLYTFVGDVNFELNDNLAIRWISGYRKFDWAHYGDSDATEYVLFEQWRYTERHEFSQELQLQGSYDRLNFTAGLYYDKGSQWAFSSRWQNLEVGTTANRAALRSFLGNNTLTIPSTGSRNNLSNPDETAKAVFAEGTYKVTDAFSATAGLRYSKITANSRTLAPCVGTPTYGVLSESFCFSSVTREQQTEYSKVTPRVSLQYQWSPDLMTYLTYSMGFDAGGINSTPDPRPVAQQIPPLPNGGLFPYDPQVLNNYELGIRSDLFGGRVRLNSSLFYGIWDDIQVQQELVPTTRWTTNAGQATVSGIEVEGAAVVSSAFRVNFNMAYLNAKYTDLGNPGQVNQLTLDTPFPFAPEYSASLGLQFNQGLAAGSKLTYRTDYGWQDVTWTNQDDLSRVKRPAYGLLSASVGYDSPNGKWGLSLAGTNLTDEYYRVSGFRIPDVLINFGNVGQPREFALNFRINFD
ncbi:MAG: TonB-dependent receptor [Steroidobacteraceae bacterium]